MAKPIHLDITTGVANSVALFNEPPPSTAAPPARGKARSGRKAQPPARGVNTMRLSLRDVATGRDKEFLIRNSTVGVHTQHRVTIIRAKQNRSKDLKVVAVINQSTGQWEDRPAMIEHVSTPRPYFGPLWKAAFLSAGLSALVFAINDLMLSDGSHFGTSVTLALLWGVLAYPVFWGVMQLWQQMSHRRRARLSRELLRAEIDHQVAIASAMASAAEQ